MSDSVGFWKRLFAGVLDGIIVSTPLAIIFGVITGDWENENFSTLFNFLYMVIIPILWYGYTVGKRIMGIRIVRMDGKKLGIGTMLLRYLVAALVYAITLGIGFIVSAFMVGIRKDHRSIHDFIAGTYVTSNKP
ncbi:RDD family protein [Peribacillus castrilensis]|uniref:Integral inner membrane protein n=1 Tax=Peribacillus simplex TaxID=1478 RepID=A0AAN2PHZ0_9BACI|nr:MULTISPECIES: RDD family protein [Bacillaceae]MCP1095673.1 RDD family protein [Bacillaceae bacterium OS4b]CRH67962.1 RDD family [Chlamydia trachomatis]MBD8589811.1 RDD family protein [Peribacillus simplex]MCF7622930.1 RDD family protein [Peribacillus frigoritolerans]MCP1153479.1 RDD family protein [Peribacillus frigoritolerans]